MRIPGTTLSILPLEQWGTPPHPSAFVHPAFPSALRRSIETVPFPLFFLKRGVFSFACSRQRRRFFLVSGLCCRTGILELPFPPYDCALSLADLTSTLVRAPFFISRPSTGLCRLFFSPLVTRLPIPARSRAPSFFKI